MQNEIKKITRLIDELTTILMKRGCKDIETRLKREESLCRITIVEHNTTYTDEEIEELHEILNIQRQCEVEGFYWELMGEDSTGDELFLLGSMIDKARVERNGENLVIEIERKSLCKCKSKKK